MRVIAGEWRGLRLTAPAGTVARPTTDRVKESMFSLLGLDWSDGDAVDLFAGSGALGLEALSRGVPRAVLIDVDGRSLQAIAENVKRVHATARVDVWKADWRAGWRRVCEQNRQIGWVFLDPPYGKKLWTEVLEQIGGGPVMPVDGVVCEHPKDIVLPEHVAGFQLWKSRVYGDIAITIYRHTRFAEGESTV